MASSVIKFIPTADLCDEEETNGAVSFRTTLLRHFGKRQRFAGKSVTVRCYEDNTVVSKALDERGEGKILVVDGGGSCARALFGDQLGAKAAKHGWAGIIINGAIRDVSELQKIEIGVVALGSCPRRSNKRGTGERDVDLEMFGVLIRPNQPIIADEDGVVVLPVEQSHL
jgi:regulator of ribonuclease activity A